MMEKLQLLMQLKAMGERPISTLTAAEIDKILDGFGFKLAVTDEVKAAAVALLQGKKMETVADMIRSPDSIAQVISLTKGDFAALLEPTVTQSEVEGMTLNFIGDIA